MSESSSSKSDKEEDEVDYSLVSLKAVLDRVSQRKPDDNGLPSDWALQLANRQNSAVV